MVTIDRTKKRIDFSNLALSGSIDYSDGIKINDFSNRLNKKKSNIGRELFIIEIYGQKFSSKEFEIVSVENVEDTAHEMISFLLARDSESLKVRVHFILDRQDTINILFQVYDRYKFGDPYNSAIRIPLLAQLELNGAEDIYYCPGNPVSTSDGRQIIKPVREYHYSSDVRLPLVVCDAQNQLGFSVRFPSLSDLNDAGSTQNESKILAQMETLEDFRNHNLHINPDASFNDTVELRITGIKNGWVEAFDRYRDEWASLYDFREYQKEDLKWFNECVVHNFTFLFGNEAFDHQAQKIDVQKLIEQGEEFGGYDTVTVWNQYPRLGVDSRNQWDFYDDFPGGRAALAEAVEEFHKKGIYVFLPYIPWDRGPNESTETMGDEFTRILKETDSDGYQLDTMHDIPLSYRLKLNQVRPGIILTSQFHPGKKFPIEIITTSWNEFWNFNPMPEVDVLRFLCPIHIAPVISRWLRHEDKDLLIKRAEFGATPIVIWQDIFGRWLPYSATQKQEIKDWKETYLKHRGIYQGLKPVPLFPTNTESLYCNVFQNDDGKSQIYSFYNDRENLVDGDELNLLGSGFERAEVVFGQGTASLAQDKLSVKIPAKKVVHVLVEK